MSVEHHVQSGETSPSFDSIQHKIREAADESLQAMKRKMVEVYSSAHIPQSTDSASCPSLMEYHQNALPLIDACISEVHSQVAELLHTVPENDRRCANVMIIKMISDAVDHGMYLVIEQNCLTERLKQIRAKPHFVALWNLWVASKYRDFIIEGPNQASVARNDYA